MYILGIEATAHTFGAAVLAVSGTKKRILANVRDMYKTKQGGLIPVKLAEHHEAVCAAVLTKALAEARVTMQDIALIAVSNAPGLGHALKAGVIFARSLALLHKKPIVGVNHCIAHLEVASLITSARDPVLLYCSGANTQVIAYDGGKYRIFGETLDIGIGNFLDTFARKLGIGFPGGPIIETFAEKGAQLITLPYSVKGMDVAFSGILTYLERKVLGRYSREDICFSVQETVFAMLVEVAERAMAHCDKDELVLGGGVACNKRLQAMAQIMCEDRNARCFIPPNNLLLDNAAMIAWTGWLMHTKGGVSDDPRTLATHPYERTDDVRVTWR
ncbi:tRNA (adenosine(37)-N6)-threonylcarbamoyltransferase complex transferase subunit TsaD [Candidatus Woesearchaeota archaeon]|nr:MAG: tRNA (adenosine(37)-N6)-threonylcarbamoyltransferase complex transferase subunit TsaD [Candidatus Woesearchaeota archaeon]